MPNHDGRRAEARNYSARWPVRLVRPPRLRGEGGDAHRGGGLRPTRPQGRQARARCPHQVSLRPRRGNHVPGAAQGRRLADRAALRVRGGARSPSANRGAPSWCSRARTSRPCATTCSAATRFGSSRATGTRRALYSLCGEMGGFMNVERGNGIGEVHATGNATVSICQTVNYGSEEPPRVVPQEIPVPSYVFDRKVETDEFNACVERGSHAVLVCGMAGVGKTTCLRKWADSR